MQANGVNLAPKSEESVRIYSRPSLPGDWFSQYLFSASKQATLLLNSKHNQLPGGSELIS